MHMIFTELQILYDISENEKKDIQKKIMGLSGNV